MPDTAMIVEELYFLEPIVNYFEGFFALYFEHVLFSNGFYLLSF